jgi:structure-specific recognition protein 1
VQDRLSVGSRPKAKAPIVVAKGKGKALGDLEYCKAQLERRKVTDKGLTTLHRVVFGQVGRHMFVKKHLREFNGVVYDAKFDRAKLEQRLRSKTVNAIREMAKILGVERGGSKEEIVERLAKFLEKPHETDAKLELASPTKKKTTTKARGKKATKKKAGSKKAAAAATKKKKGSKKEKAGPKRPLSAYMYFVKDKRPEIAKKNPKDSVTEVAKKLGEMWRKVKDRTEYEALAAKDKKRYEKEKAK